MMEDGSYGKMGEGMAMDVSETVRSGNIPLIDGCLAVVMVF